VSALRALSVSVPEWPLVGTANFLLLFGLFARAFVIGYLVRPHGMGMRIIRHAADLMREIKRVQYRIGDWKPLNPIREVSLYSANSRNRSCYCKVISNMKRLPKL
jgi:hypothetical protein